MQKAVTKTLRISQKDFDIIEKFQKTNPIFDNFSTLVRVAILDFVSKKGLVRIRPVKEEVEEERLSFLWDYDLTGAEVHEMLAGPREKARWLIARILEHAQFKEVWKYLTPDIIEQELPHLRLPKKVLEHWKYAIKCWKVKK